MENQLNKPRVFLSHSSNDVSLIETMQADFRACQIDSWRDQTDIRDGQPWMEAIFEHGIPACDAILAYFTPEALNSRTFAREVDAAILLKLRDNNIAFLPYVCEGSFRKELRLDIQSLHCREWNLTNYSTILPSVVGEIWRSYLDRVVVDATRNEKLKRLELEIEVDRLKKKASGSIFTPKEETEFDYLRKSLDIELELKIGAYALDYDEILRERRWMGNFTVVKSFLDLLVGEFRQNHRFLSNRDFRQTRERILNLLGEIGAEYSFGEVFPFSNFIPTLIKFELLSNNRDYVESYEYTKKMRRFVYWLEYHKIEYRQPSIDLHLFEDR